MTDAVPTSDRDGPDDADSVAGDLDDFADNDGRSTASDASDSALAAASRSGPAAELIASVRSILRVLGCVTAAMQPPRLVVGLMLAAALMVSGRVWDAVAGPNIPAGGLTVRAFEIEVEPMRPFAASLDAAILGTQGVARGVLTLDPSRIATSCADLFLGIPIGLWRHDPIFLFGYGLIFVALTGLFGGTLARMAACDVAGGERLGAEAGIGFAAACWRSLVLAPLAPLLIALLLWSIIALIGVALRWPWVEILGAILVGPALVLGALVALSLLGYALAFPLLVPAIACERCDAGEAQQRAFAYLLQRPGRLVMSMAIGIVGFGIGYLVVAGVAATTLQVTAWGLVATAGDAGARIPEGYRPFTLTPPAVEVPDGASASITAGILGVWRTIIVGLVAGWVFAYYYAASTTIYLGLRESADGQEPSEIWRPGMVHGTFVLTDDDTRTKVARSLDGRWRRTLQWIARRRS